MANPRGPQHASQPTLSRGRGSVLHMERLRQLHSFLAMAEAHANDCRAAAEDAEALVRDTKAAIAKETKERRHLRALPLLFPAVLTAAGAAGRWAGRNTAGAAAFGAGAAVAAVTAVGVVQLGGDPPTGSEIVTAPTAPAATSPPARHPPARPPKGSRPPGPPPASPNRPTPGPPSVSPSPLISVAPSAHLPTKIKPPHLRPPKLPHTPPGKPSNPHADNPPTVKDDCRIDLLGTGILCGHLLSSGQLPTSPLS
jgi:hypothetical protein